MADKIFHQSVNETLRSTSAWAFDSLKDSKVTLVTVGLGLPVGAYVLGGLWSSLFSSLAKYPGPSLARWTRLWYLYQANTGNSHLELQRLHDKHGPVVRIAPNLLDIDDPEIIKDVYSQKNEWLKTEFYHASSALVNGQIVLNLFSETNPAKHAKERRPIGKYYSTAAMTSLEPHMDKVIEQLCYQLETRFASKGAILDFSDWINYYTWDVVGAVTFSKPIGYLEHGTDFDGTLRNADKAMDYFALVGAIPFLDRVFDKNPIYRLGPPGFNVITGISVGHLINRYQGNDKEHHDSDTPDFLDHFIEAKNNDPDNVDDAQIISWLMVNMIAGADTTAILMRSAVYYSLKHPQVWSKLVEEIRTAVPKQSVPVAYKDVRNLPYLDAVVRESSRFHPGVAMTLERYVPKGGYTLSNGDYLPEGLAVGMNPYIANRNKSVFGLDANEFRPERWLRDEAAGETEDQFKTRLSAMNKADLSFGAGARVCIGKNMALWQVFKVLATLIALYDFELVTKEWTVINSFFMRQEDFKVKITRV